MLLTFLATIKVPSEDPGYLYHWIWIMHLAMTLALVVNHFFEEKLGIMKSTLNTSMMLFQVVLLIYMCFWLFPNVEVQVDQIEEDMA